MISSSQTRKVKLYLLSLLFFAGAGLIAAVTAELSLRWYSVSRAEEKLDHVEETEYTPIRFKGNYQGSLWGIMFRTNRFGFRDEPEFSQEPEAGEYRILSLGDSIGFGLGIPSKDHYTKVLQKELSLDSREVDFRVINAGGQGYCPSGYYTYLKNEGIKLKPDLVIIETEICNDTSDEALLQWGKTGADGHPQKIMGGRYVVSWDGKQLGTYSTRGYFFEKTYLYANLTRRVLNLAQRISPQAPWSERPGARVYYSLGFDRFLLDKARLEEGHNRLFSALSGTVRLLEAEGIKCVIMIMPSRYLYQDAYDYTLVASELYKNAVESAREMNLPFLEMYGTIKENGGEDLFLDFAHLTIEGNKAVGLELYNQFPVLPSM
ncbi:MAG: hypothetical protein ABIJ42_10915 [Acidobacteriota bacterium]